EQGRGESGDQEFHGDDLFAKLKSLTAAMPDRTGMKRRPASRAIIRETHARECRHPDDTP
ncbi:MAG: hypothetical protein ACT6Q3_06570, partial [Sphingopyxis sp.]